MSYADGNWSSLSSQLTSLPFLVMDDRCSLQLNPPCHSHTLSISSLLALSSSLQPAQTCSCVFARVFLCINYAYACVHPLSVCVLLCACKVDTSFTCGISTIALISDVYNHEKASIAKTPSRFARCPPHTQHNYPSERPADCLLIMYIRNCVA